MRIVSISNPHHLIHPGDIEFTLLFYGSGTKLAAHRLKIIFGLAGMRAAELHGNLTQVQRLDVSIFLPRETCMLCFLINQRF